MAENPCAVLLVACCDVMAGICLDFISVRKYLIYNIINLALSCGANRGQLGHGCTENCCNCQCGSDPGAFETDAGEREPLIGARQEPVAHPPMQVRP